MSKAATTWTFPDLPGYVEKRGQKASSRWQRHGKNYRLTHPIPFHPKNRAIVHGLHRRFVEDLLKGSMPTKSRPATLHAAIAEFYEAHTGVLSAAAKRTIAQGIDYFLDVDMELDRERLYRHLVRRQKEAPEGHRALNPQTRRRYLKQVQRLCRWLVMLDYIDKDPVSLIGVPPRMRKPVLYWEPDTMAAMVAYQRDRARASKTGMHFSHTQKAIFLDIASLIGARPAELLKMRIEDITSDRILIFGKADPTRGASNARTEAEDGNPRACRDQYSRMREIPLMPIDGLSGEAREWQRRLQAVIEEARSYSRRNDGWLTTFCDRKSIGNAVREYKDVAGLVDDPRSLRHFRQGARYYMENVVQLDPYAIADILGHTPAVSFESYRPAASAREIADRIKGPGGIVGG